MLKKGQLLHCHAYHKEYHKITELGFELFSWKPHPEVTYPSPAKQDQLTVHLHHRDICSFTFTGSFNAKNCPRTDRLHSHTEQTGQLQLLLHYIKLFSQVLLASNVLICQLTCWLQSYEFSNVYWHQHVSRSSLCFKMIQDLKTL